MTIERENGGPVLAMIIELLLTWRIGVKILLTRLWLYICLHHKVMVWLRGKRNYDMITSLSLTITGSSCHMFFLELSGRKKPSLVYYDYIIKLIPINIPIFPLIPSSRYSFCGFPVSTLDSGILTDSTSLVPARTCSIMAF